MRSDTALARLQDGELCIITTLDGERNARWSLASWCFYYLERGTPIVCPTDEIEEWRPVSAKL